MGEFDDNSAEEVTRFPGEEEHASSTAASDGDERPRLELHWLICQSILEYLDKISDVVRYRAVCTAWRNAAAAIVAPVTDSPHGAPLTVDEDRMALAGHHFALDGAQRLSRGIIACLVGDGLATVRLRGAIPRGMIEALLACPTLRTLDIADCVLSPHEFNLHADPHASDCSSSLLITAQPPPSAVARPMGLSSDVSDDWTLASSWAVVDSEGNSLAATPSAVTARVSSVEHLTVPYECASTILRALLKRCRKLRSIKGAFGKGVGAMVGVCRELRDITLERLCAAEADFVRLVSSSPQLERLAAPWQGITLPLVDAVVNHCPNLAELHCYGMPDQDVIEAISRRLTSLRDFTIRGADELWHVDDIAALPACTSALYFSGPSNFDGVVRHCPNLRAIDVCDISVRGSAINLKHIAAHCSQLEHVSLARAVNWTKSEFRRLARLCPNVRTLDLTEPRSAVDDEILHAAANAWARLEVLRVGYFPQAMSVTDGGIVHVARQCPHLRVFECAAPSYAVTDTSVIALAKGCPVLEELRFVMAHPHITDASVAVLSARCPSLRQLRLAGCAVFGGNFRALVDGCPHLEQLDVSNCPLRIPETALKVAVRWGRRLRELTIDEDFDTAELRKVIPATMALVVVPHW